MPESQIASPPQPRAAGAHLGRLPPEEDRFERPFFERVIGRAGATVRKALRASTMPKGHRVAICGGIPEPRSRVLAGMRETRPGCLPGPERRVPEDDCAWQRPATAPRAPGESIQAAPGLHGEFRLVSLRGHSWASRYGWSTLAMRESWAMRHTSGSPLG